jgi:hypothetical protein
MQDARTGQGQCVIRRRETYSGGWLKGRFQGSGVSNTILSVLLLCYLNTSIAFVTMLLSLAKHQQPLRSC